MSDLRRISDLLPEVLQTDVLKKFFAATADHLFQPESVEYLNAYIGQRPSYSAPGDVYVQEANGERQAYQVDATAVSREYETNNITNMMFYSDLLNRLRYQGGLTNDPNRLFETEYYSFGLPFDVDKFVNYTNYVWLANGPATITLLSSTSASTISQGANYTYTGEYSYANDPKTVVDGAVSGNELVFSTGLKVRFAGDADPLIRNLDYIIEGVGQRIFLVSDTFSSTLAWENPVEYDSTVWDSTTTYQTPTYVLIQRGSANQNPWSRRNRWFHRDILQLSRTTVLDINTISGRRHILEFDRNIELYNFGKLGRGRVNMVDTSTKDLSEIQGRSGVIISGIPLDDEQLILFTALKDPLANNRIYRVSNIRASNQAVLELVPRGKDSTGAPVRGDCVTQFEHSEPARPTLDHTRWESSEWLINWYYDGVKWVLGQSWDPINLTQAPLFALYDVSGNSLSDPSVYPLSSFAGSTLFEYQTQSHGLVDPVLGLIPVTDPNQTNEYLFENTLVTQSYNYQSGILPQPILGLLNWKTQLPKDGTDFFANNWFRAPCPSRQYVVNEYFSTLGQRQFAIDLEPTLTAQGPPGISVNAAGRDLVLGSGFTVSGQTVTLNTSLLAGSFVKIRTWNQTSNVPVNGYAEIPRNLEANPINGEIEVTNRSQLLPHLSSMINNQSTTWRDSARDQSLGTQIVQHRAPLLKLMILNSISQSNVINSSTSELDPMSAMQWAQREYLRFYNKFVTSLINLYTNSSYTGAETPDAWITQALRSVNLAKTPASPWANSGFEGVPGAYCSVPSTNPTYVPATPTRLGVTPASSPRAFYDHSQPNSPLSLECHNGAVVVLRGFDGVDLGEILGGQDSTNAAQNLSHPIARAWLTFEQRLYQSLPSQYGDPEARPALDPRTIFSAKWRTTNYSREDQLTLLRPMFDNWTTLNQLDAFKNTTFEITDPYSWNYSKCLDIDGNAVPGNWRGIYRWYYDTDRPHLAPWEMVGFSQKPTWWDSEYGAAPYSSGNLRMWSDLRDGRVRQGPRMGVYSEWARPRLLECIPVDSAGDLLPPVAAGAVMLEPSVIQARADWQFGDGSPIENVWQTTVDYSFVVAQTAYLAKPAQFIEYNWDPTQTIEIFPNQSNSQWVSSSTLKRKTPGESLVHRENPSNVTSITSSDTYFGSGGIQQWISESVVNSNRDVTTYFGNIVRGCGVNLGYRVGGFTDGTSIKLLVDSFGLSANDSLLLPQEDATTNLYRSPSVREFFYSGVIVENMGSAGWRVIGYDSVNPTFTIIPSLLTGRRSTVVIDKQKVVEYQQGQKAISLIPYGSILSTRQDVYDFLVSLGRWQVSQGWIFDQWSDSNNRLTDWSLSAREFLFWSQGPWAPGTFIALSPLARQIKFSTDFGMIQYVGGVVNGSYSMLDRGGRAIATQSVDFLRIDNSISVRPLGDQAIYGLRLYTSSIEHALIFNNSTVFGDTVYDPVQDIRQDRFKLLAFRTLNWNGRMEAPGYMVTQTSSTIGDITVLNNRIISNFEKSVTDLRTMYNMDHPTPYTVGTQTNQVSTVTQSTSSSVRKLAWHLIGYQSREYLNNLLVDDTTQLQFYQGMIQQKGTANSIDALLRNTNVISATESFDYYEEFAFRTGEYGATEATKGIDVVLDQSKFISNPQIVELLGSSDWDSLQDDTVTIVPGSSSILDATPHLGQWPTRSYYGPGPQDLPTAGYVLPTEVDYTVVDDTALLALWTTQNSFGTPLVPGNRVWKYIDPTNVWNVYKISNTPYGISGSLPSTGRTGASTTITTTQPHGLAANTFVIVNGLFTNETSISGTYQISNVTSTTFDIPVTTSSAGTGGSLLVYFSTRYPDYNSLLNPVNETFWLSSDLAYVDGTSTRPWAVYQTSGQWIKIREEEPRVDSSLLLTSRLYNRTTLNHLADLTFWDPVKGAIPFLVDKELNYRTPYDPAQYNVSGGYQQVDPQLAWGENEVGVTWWDLSTTRFIDYETGKNSYRRQHWGQIAPGTTVDIYEWVRSLVPPTAWSSAVASGNSAATGGGSLPTGSILGTNPPYVQINEITEGGNYAPAYYFWVRNQTVVPGVPFRTQSTAVMSQMIAQPQNFNIAWWAPINTYSALLGNVGTSLDHDQTVWQVNWSTLADLGNVYRQWTLLRPNDPRSFPTSYLWNRMRYSLVERDATGASVPDLYLSDRARLGILSRPNQSWFRDASAARRALVTRVNSILAASTVPPATDPERIGWLEYFESAEPVPPVNNTLAPVRLATTTALEATYDNGQGGTGAILTSLTKQILQVDGLKVVLGDRILVKDQTTGMTTGPYQNGVYQVVSTGSTTEPWILSRVRDFSSTDQMTLASIAVTDGAANQNTFWYQSNPSLARVGIDSIEFASGVPGDLYARKVSNLAERDALSLQVPLGQSVWVGATAATNNRWTIWQWTETDPGSYEWQLTRMQSYVTSNCWSYVDWFATGYSNATAVSQKFDTLAGRDGYTDYQDGDLVYVSNTGNGRWGLYRYSGSNSLTFTLIGQQSGGIQLSSNLWDYASYQMGFDGGGFARDYQGWEYDTRLELDQIIQGLWPSASGAQGLLKADATSNEYNSLFFEMVNQTLSEQTFVDWIFKTSFINLRGFAQQLAATPYYEESKVEEILGYINEIKPYRTKIREFVDYRTTQDTWYGSATDSDRPPYNYRGQIRILDEDGPLDQAILNTNSLYTSWFNNYQANPGLIRKIRTSVVLDRVAGASTPTTVQGKIPASTMPAIPLGPTVPVLQPQTIEIASSVGLVVGALISVVDRDDNSIGKFVIEQLSNNSLTYQTYYPLVPTVDLAVTISLPTVVIDGGLVENVSSKAPWTATITGLNNTLGLVVGAHITAHDSIDTNGVVLGSLGHLGTYIITSVSDHSVTYQAQEGTAPRAGAVTGITYQPIDRRAIDRVNALYQPTGDMVAANSPSLISGDVARGMVMDGANFNNQGLWDGSPWDSWQPWDETDADFQRFFDLSIQGDQPPAFWTFQGNGVRTGFVLPEPPQQPSRLAVWVRDAESPGTLLTTPQDWILHNSISSVSVLSPGLGYEVNDVLEINIGGSTIPARIRVTNTDPIGAILAIETIDSGQYQTPTGPNSVPAHGGHGIEAILSVTWAGTNLEFVSPPEAANVPNIWVLQAGNTFEDVGNSGLNGGLDGGALADAHTAGNHPEELMPIWYREGLTFDVYTQPTPGIGPVLTQSFRADSITDHYPLGQLTDGNTTVQVHHNGVLQTMGPGADYVLDLETQRVVFVLPPSNGTVNVVTYSGNPAFTTDTFAGNSGNTPNVYALSHIPSSVESVRVQVNGQTLDPFWDYQVTSHNSMWQVQILGDALANNDRVQIVYPTDHISIPGVAFRVFNDIYNRTSYLRLSDHNSTYLNQDLDWNATQVVVGDGRPLEPGYPQNPGVIWIGGERIEYLGQEAVPTVSSPHQMILSPVIRRTRGTPGGIPDRFQSQFWNGDSVSSLFLINLMSPAAYQSNPVDLHVIVDGVERSNGVDFTVQVNPVGHPPGAYIVFASTSIPSAGTNNVMMTVLLEDWSTTTVSHHQGSLVRAGGNSQLIPGGYRWSTFSSVVSLDSATSITYQAQGGLPPALGTVTNIRVPIGPNTSTVVSLTGTIATVTGTGPWTATITGMTSTAGLDVGTVFTADPGTGRLQGNSIQRNPDSLTEFLLAAPGQRLE